MSFVRILATAGASLGVAIVAGLYAAPEQPQTALRAEAPAAARVSAPASLIAGWPEAVAPVPNIAHFAPEPAAAPRLSAGRPGAGPVAAVEIDTATDLRASDAGSCSLRAELAAQPAAMLSLVVTAPCDAGEPLAISHGALLLAEPVGPDGRLALALPALRAEAGVTLATVDGRVLQVSAQVPDFDLYQRVLVSWEGPAVLELHAFAGGAGWDEAGHVRAGGPVSAATGFVTAFGDPELGGPQARIYTYPVGIAATAGHVAVDAMVAVTDESCGRPFAAEVTAMLGGGRSLTRRLDIAMPDCGGVGSYVMIPDLVPAAAVPGLAVLE